MFFLAKLSTLKCNESHEYDEFPAKKVFLVQKRDADVTAFVVRVVVKDPECLFSSLLIASFV